MQIVQPNLLSNVCTGLKYVADDIVDGLRHVLDVLFAHWMSVLVSNCRDVGWVCLQPLMEARPDLSR